MNQSNLFQGTWNGLMEKVRIFLLARWAIFSEILRVRFYSRAERAVWKVNSWGITVTQLQQVSLYFILRIFNSARILIKWSSAKNVKNCNFWSLIRNVGNLFDQKNIEIFVSNFSKNQSSTIEECCTNGVTNTILEFN